MPQGRNDKPFDTCGFTSQAEVDADRARCAREPVSGREHSYGEVRRTEAAALGPYGRPMFDRI